jgi:DNA-binding NarL/FixJ family response regulator
MKSSPRRLHIALVDDHAVVREGYRRLLETEPDMEVVSDHGHAASLEAALATGSTAELIVLDLSMPGLNGLALLRRLREGWPRLRILIFTMHESLALVEQCLDAGAAGYITKSSAPEVLVDAVRRAHRGETALSCEVEALVRQRARRRAPHHLLSPRELDVLWHLLGGRSLDEIAERLRLTPKTVSNYQALIRQKLRVSSAVDLWQYARRHGLVDPDGVGPAIQES